MVAGTAVNRLLVSGVPTMLQLTDGGGPPQAVPQGLAQREEVAGMAVTGVRLVLALPSRHPAG